MTGEDMEKRLKTLHNELRDAGFQVELEYGQGFWDGIPLLDLRSKAFPAFGFTVLSYADEEDEDTTLPRPPKHEGPMCQNW